MTTRSRNGVRRGAAVAVAVAALGGVGTALVAPAASARTAVAIPATSAWSDAMGNPPCTTDQLDITFWGFTGGPSHSGGILVFNNTGGACMMHGYPGVAGVGTGDTPVVQARQTPAGYLGGVPNGTAPTVTLQQKQYASALYEGIVGTQPGDPPCPKFVDLLVTAPDDTRQARRLSSVPAGSVCGLEIHPVVAGTNGGANIPPPDDKH